ncbi:hypothetical protein J4E83_005165 [Alternaria metachromatica]|uniref:uncharacterized protein n=1 Tax=Alternaria metachromatica TaxID=283354 RepID=UPI0020C55021|nr:uncharacterized protein J4E83_005165 [Alternaria metachromatica]KAI4620804.1 hypothetical protein J4E83_005165 [Alternaria metachromatica]
MSSTEHTVANNDNQAKESTITKPSEGTCGSVLDTDNDVVTVDEQVAEDQEMEDSYVFVEADYHSYTDVESSVAEGSGSDCGLSEREEEGNADSKNDAEIMEEQNGGVRRGFVKKTTEKKTSGPERDGGKNDGIDLPDIVKTMVSLFLRSINGTGFAGLSRESLQRKPGMRNE